MVQENLQTARKSVLRRETMQKSDKTVNDQNKYIIKKKN